MLAAMPSMPSRTMLLCDLDRIANEATKSDEQKPPTVKQVAARRYKEVSEMGASKVVILDSCCFRMRKKKKNDGRWRTNAEVRAGVGTDV